MTKTNDYEGESISEMSFQEKVDWALGHLVLGIGEGEFRAHLSMVLMMISDDAYERGYKDAMKHREAMPRSPAC